MFSLSNTRLLPRLFRYLPLAVALAALVAVGWVLVNRPSDEARWLEVEIPAQIVSGGRMPITLTLKAPNPAGFLCVDLHWLDRTGKPRGYLSTGQPRLIRFSEPVYRFDVPLPPRPSLEAVVVVIYVSDTGDWSATTRSCTFGPVAVSPTPDPGLLGHRRRVDAREQRQEPAPPRQDSQRVRWGSAMLWSVVGLLAWRMRPRMLGTALSSTPPRAARWLGLALACWMAVAWELSSAETGLGEWFRKIAMAQGLYDGRRPAQEALTVIVIAVSMLASFVSLRRGRGQPISVVFSGVDAYWAISAVSFISLHDADAWLATSVLTVPLVQVLKLAAAVIALSGAVRAASEDRPAQAH